MQIIRTLVRSSLIFIFLLLVFNNHGLTVRANGWPILDLDQFEYGGFTNEEPKVVKFCELVRPPDIFNGQLVRVQAIWTSNWEWQMLSHPNCHSRANYVWPTFDCDSLESCAIISRALEKDMVGNPSKVIITVIGRFRGTREGRKHYGVLGGLKYQLEISTLVETKRIRSGKARR